MPKENPPGFVDQAKANADVASKLLKQDLINTPPETATASDALDKLAKEHTEKNPPKVEPIVVEPNADDAAKKAAEEKAKADKEAADKAAGGNPPEPTAEEKAKAEKLAAEVEQATKDKEAAEKYFKDSPQLPAGASPKSAEAFSAIKIRAARDLAAKEADLEKLRKEKADLEAKLKNPIPPELEKELEGHREWRAKLDVESDPKFKAFDKTIASTEEFIYAQLRKSPAVNDDVIKKIKELGGPANVNLANVFEAAKDPTLQRIVESKVAEIEMAKFQKEEAIKLAKTNIKEYMGERTKAMQAAAVSHTTATSQRMTPLVESLEWFKEKSVDAAKTPEEKTAATEHNAFIKTTKEQLTAALNDDSAEMRAILLTGMAQLFHLQRVHAPMAKKIETLEKQLAEVTEKWERVKKASTSRGGESAANAAGGIVKANPTEQVNTRPGDALDALAKQVMDQRAAKGV